MMEEIRIPIHKQMLQLIYIKHIYTCNAKWDPLQLDNDKYIFRVCVSIFNRWKRAWDRDNYNY